MKKELLPGANKSGNPGKFELADGGTIFLDEIGDMPLEVQASLLRVIQNKEVVRIGGKYPKTINVRIIAATNKNLQQAVSEKSFREDLYYRLNVFAIYVPTLAQRNEDIRQLTDYFCKQYAPGRDLHINDDVYKLFLNYDWPGNIRQLENVIERAVNIVEGNVITVNELPPDIIHIDYPFKKTSTQPVIDERFPTNTQNNSNYVQPQNTPIPKRLPKGKNEKEHILKALNDCNGNMTLAAESLGISRRTIYRKLEKYNIDVNEYRTF